MQRGKKSINIATMFSRCAFGSAHALTHPFGNNQLVGGQRREGVGGSKLTVRKRQPRPLHCSTLLPRSGSTPLPLSPQKTFRWQPGQLVTITVGMSIAVEVAVDWQCEPQQQHWDFINFITVISL